MILRKIFLLSILVLILAFSTLVYAQVPQMINYQGKITTPQGALMTITTQMVFSIYTDSTGGTPLWTETQPSVKVEYGVFSVLLGSVNPIPYSVFNGSVRYLGLKVGNDLEMTPRKVIVSVVYAYKSSKADTSDYARAGAGGVDNDWTFRITDTADTTLITGGAWGIARYGNVLYGNADSTHVNLGVACTTGTDGGDMKYCAVAGGWGNTASSSYAAVGGGQSNTAYGSWTTVAGGWGNTASGSYAAVGGGNSNTATLGANVAGGSYNTADYAATVGGGSYNRASSYLATVAGGVHNSATDWFATVAGGSYNTASNLITTVGGGDNNTASQWGATVGGGEIDTASGAGATVSGGAYNTASGYYSTVSGGSYNITSGQYSTVPGGHRNSVAGGNSFATGGQVKLTPDANFTFAFGCNFTTSTPHAVVFYDSLSETKVGIQTTSPTARLDVKGSTGYDQIRMRTSYTPTGTSDVNGNVGDIAWDDDYFYVRTSAGWKRVALGTW